MNETWAYAAEGKIRSFVNGDYSGQEDTFVDTTAPQNAVHPQDFTFESTPEAIISKYGQPAAVQTKTVWSGTFNHYIYNTLALGFLNNTLVSVISVGAASSATNYETHQTKMSKCPDSKTADRRSINEFTTSMLKMGKSGFEEARILSDALKDRKGAAATATASETVNTGVLFTYASLLGLAAQQGVQGAQSDWSSCMAGIYRPHPPSRTLTVLRTPFQPFLCSWQSQS